MLFAEFIAKLAGWPPRRVLRALAVGVGTGVVIGGLTALLFPGLPGVVALTAGVAAGLSSSAQLGRPSESL